VKKTKEIEKMCFDAPNYESYNYNTYSFRQCKELYKNRTSPGKDYSQLVTSGTSQYLKLKKGRSNSDESNNLTRCLEASPHKGMSSSPPIFGSERLLFNDEKKSKAVDDELICLSVDSQDLNRSKILLSGKENRVKQNSA
jgi:hypothetical protein